MKVEIASMILATAATVAGAAQVPTEGRYTLTSLKFQATGSKCFTDPSIKYRFLLVAEPADKKSDEYSVWRTELAGAETYQLNIERPRSQSLFFGNAPCGGNGPALYCGIGLYLTPFVAEKGAYFYRNNLQLPDSDGMQIRYVNETAVELSWVFDGCVIKNTAALAKAGQPTGITEVFKLDRQCNVEVGANLGFRDEELPLLRENYGCVPAANTTTTRQTTTTVLPTTTLTPPPPAQCLNITLGNKTVCFKSGASSSKPQAASGALWLSAAAAGLLGLLFQ